MGQPLAAGRILAYCWQRGERLPGARAVPASPTLYRALRTLANRLVGVLQGCLRTHILYYGHLAWHNELDKLSPAA